MTSASQAEYGVSITLTRSVAAILRAAISAGEAENVASPHFCYVIGPCRHRSCCQNWLGKKWIHTFCQIKCDPNAAHAGRGANHATTVALYESVARRTQSGYTFIHAPDVAHLKA